MDNTDRNIDTTSALNPNTSPARHKRGIRKGDYVKPCFITEEMEEQWRREGRADLLKRPIYTQPYGK